MGNSELKNVMDKVNEQDSLFSSDLKDGLDKIHVPEALLQNALLKMQEENEALLKGTKERQTGEEYPELDQYYNRKKTSLFSKRSFGMLFAAGLAAVAFAVYSRSASSQMWQNIQIIDEPYYKAAASAEANAISIEEFEQKTDIPVLPYMTLDGYSSYTCYISDAGYETRLDYSRGDNYVLILSRSGSAVSSKIDTSKYEEIEGRKVSFAKDKKEGMLACLWEDELGSYYLYGFTEEKEFIAFLNDILTLQQSLH